MACFHPWKPDAALGFPPTLRLPCGQCIGCRLRRSAEWATRCMHEAALHQHNCWITLTYDDEHLPRRYHTGRTHPKTGKAIYAGSLDKRHPQRFYRSLRKSLGKKYSLTDTSILYTMGVHTDMGHSPIPRLKPILRYYYGGEYGEQYGRPHYHLCLFGIDFSDKIHVQTTDAGYKLYESQRLKKFWPHGQHMIGELTWETAAYTARYIMKKITGQKQKEHYKKIDNETGEIIEIEPEYNDMSRKPGIANKWWMEYHTDVYKQDTSQVRIRGRTQTPPRYYDKLYERSFPDHYKHIKLQRAIENLNNRGRHTPARLQAEEIITTTKTQGLKQKL